MKIRYSSSFLLLILLVSNTYASSDLDISSQNSDEILAQNNKNLLTFNSSSLFGDRIKVSTCLYFVVRIMLLKVLIS